MIRFCGRLNPPFQIGNLSATVALALGRFKDIRRLSLPVTFAARDSVTNAYIRPENFRSKVTKVTKPWIRSKETSAVSVIESFS